MDATTHGRIFIDSNVLVYAFDDNAPTKQARAQDLLRDLPLESVVLSGQVLGEFYWTTTRKIPMPLTSTEAASIVEGLSSFIVVPIDENLVRSAINLTDSASLAYWDALIIRAAALAGCSRLLTEDLSHGQIVDGVRVENPFLGL